MFRRSTAPLQYHIKNTEVQPVSLSYAYKVKKEARADNSLHPQARSTPPHLTPKSALRKQRGSHQRQSQ